MFRHRTVARHLLYALDFSGELDCVLMPILLFGQLCFRLPAYSCIHNILRRKGKANRECDKYRHPFCKSIPWYSDRQPSAVFHLKNRVFLTEYHEIPCLHSLFCSPSSKRCKKLIPDGIQPIKKTAHEGQAKSKKFLPQAPVNKNFKTSLTWLSSPYTPTFRKDTSKGHLSRT